MKVAPRGIGGAGDPAQVLGKKRLQSADWGRFSFEGQQLRPVVRALRVMNVSGCVDRQGVQSGLELLRQHRVDGAMTTDTAQFFQCR